MDRLWRSNSFISSRTGCPPDIVNVEDHNIEKHGAFVPMCLRDTRSNNFKDNIFGIVNVSLDDDPVYFNCYPEASSPYSKTASVRVPSSDHQCFFAIKRFGKQISLLIINVTKLKSKSTIFDKLSNEVMSNLYVFISRMLNRILKDVDGTGIVIVDGKMLLTNTIIMEEFLHL